MAYFLAAWNGQKWEILPAVAVAVPLLYSGWAFIPTTPDFPVNESLNTAHPLKESNSATPSFEQPPPEAPIDFIYHNSPFSTSKLSPTLREIEINSSKAEQMADSEDISNTCNPRKLRVKVDDECVTLYQAFPPTIAEPAVKAQSLVAAPEFSIHRMTWFKTSFTQIMHVSKFAQREAWRSRILAFRVTFCGLEDILKQARLSYQQDVTTSGEVDTSAPVHVIWDPSRTALGNKSHGSKCMHIGVSGPVLEQMVNNAILSIEDVTTKATELAAMVNNGDQTGAEKFIEALGEEELPLENEEIEWNLGML